MDNPTNPRQALINQIRINQASRHQRLNGSSDRGKPPRQDGRRDPFADLLADLTELNDILIANGFEGIASATPPPPWYTHIQYYVETQLKPYYLIDQHLVSFDHTNVFGKCVAWPLFWCSRVAVRRLPHAAPSAPLSCPCPCPCRYEARNKLTLPQRMQS